MLKVHTNANIYNKAYKYEPDFVVGIGKAALVFVYAKVNDIEKAMQYWQKAVEAGNDSKVLIRKIRNRKYIRENEK